MNIDRWIIEFDRALRTVALPAAAGLRHFPQRPARPTPGRDCPEAEMSETERRHAAALMRINHTGEICAQALYQGQSLTSRQATVQDTLRQAADEETEHLAWTEERIAELGGRKSLLNPLWYAGALAMGAFAGRLGDSWNLGFLAETERQVETHLAGHLEHLPQEDRKSRAVLKQMKEDEIQHAQTAVQLGARPLPVFVKKTMKLAARFMVRTTYYL